MSPSNGPDNSADRPDGERYPERRKQGQRLGGQHPIRRPAPPSQPPHDAPTCPMLPV